MVIYRNVKIAYDATENQKPEDEFDQMGDYIRGGIDIPLPVVEPEEDFDTDEGYEKGYTLDGYPAVEKYTNESKDGSLSVFIAPRYLVEVTARGLDSKALQEWWKKIDVKKLMELKAS